MSNNLPNVNASRYIRNLNIITYMNERRPFNKQNNKTFRLKLRIRNPLISTKMNLFSLSSFPRTSFPGMKMLSTTVRRARQRTTELSRRVRLVYSQCSVSEAGTGASKYNYMAKYIYTKSHN